MRWLLVLLAACAPAIDTPVERGRTADREDAITLAQQLQHLPGVVHADVVLRRPVTDPLATSPAPPPTGAIVLGVDDRADHATLDRDARALLHATAPSITDATVTITTTAVRPTLAKVGPFTVESSSKPLLVTTLALLLLAVAALAGVLAYRSRPRSSV